MTVNVHYGQLWKSLKYHYQIVQPANIVLIPNLKAYLKFVDVTRTFPMASPVWFTLFLYTQDNSTHDHCHEPIGNPFNLAFNTEMLVLCHNETILREWYSIKGDTVKIFDLAKWKGNKGFIPLTNMSLYERRNDMEGVVLRATTVEEFPVFSKFNGNHAATMYRNVLEDLMYSLNFTVKVVSQMTEYGTWNRRTLLWSGVIGEVTAGRADLGVMDMSYTDFRVLFVDFTVPLTISENNLYIKKPEICVNWFGYFQTFNLSTWVMIIMVITIALLLLSFMKVYRESRSTVNSMSENFIHIWGIFCQQPLIEFPKSWSLRVSYFTLFLTALLVMSHYSASIICFLTTCTPVLPFQTIEEFVDVGTYKLIIQPGTANYEIVNQAEFKSSKQSFFVKLMKLMKDESELPRTQLGTILQVCNEENVASLMMSYEVEIVKNHIPCKVSSIMTHTKLNSGMILSKNSPYTDVINYHLQKFLELGVIKRLRNMKYLKESDKNKVYESVHLGSVIPNLTILCGGFIISTTMLIIEKIQYRSQRRKFQSKILSFQK